MHSHRAQFALPFDCCAVPPLHTLTLWLLHHPSMPRWPGIVLLPQRLYPCPRRSPEKKPVVNSTMQALFGPLILTSWVLAPVLTCSAVNVCIYTTHADPSGILTSRVKKTQRPPGHTAVNYSPNLGHLSLFNLAPCQCDAMPAIGATPSPERSRLLCANTLRDAVRVPAFPHAHTTCKACLAPPALFLNHAYRPFCIDLNPG